MKHVRIAARVVALAAVVLVGVGACALDPQGDSAGAAAPMPVAMTETTSGANAYAPTPNQSTQSTTTAAVSKSSATGCPLGEHQRAVEKYLNKLGGFGKLTEDGKQSAADCVAIKKFQRRYGISPASGRAGPTTYDVAKRLATTDVRRCKAGSGLTFCIDLTRQTVWAMRSGKVVMRPTVTRTGMAGYATPTGAYRVGWRSKKAWSTPYKVWLPYWQQFNGGIGFHETTTYLHNKSIGSHGCINLLHKDAVQLWKLGKVGTRVVVFGHRAGT
ncbi:L,D-transpeptidase family protein [Micromonospora sp. NPDC048999]|uniref:L,D-transpeptidase family protein n=1 Tax=Micromonospora sp. NPDC048999 TaxID=3155391 RepID=UPI0033DE2857